MLSQGGPCPPIFGGHEEVMKENIILPHPALPTVQVDTAKENLLRVLKGLPDSSHGCKPVGRYEDNATKPDPEGVTHSVSHLRRYFSSNSTPASIRRLLNSSAKETLVWCCSWSLMYWISRSVSCLECVNAP
jgi:hypothetical protein